MHLFPADLQVLEMSDSDQPSAHIPNLRTVPALKIQTSEGYTVSVDVTVLYRIEDPYKVMTQIGPGRLYEDSVVIPRAEQHLRRTFGELDAEEFYKGDTREKAAADAQRLLTEELAPRGITVTHVLVRAVPLRRALPGGHRAAEDPGPDGLQEPGGGRRRRRRRPRRTASSPRARRRWTWSTRAATPRCEKLESEADLYTRTKAAEGELVVRLAEAQGTQLENNALRGLGSENMVGLKMAEALQGRARSSSLPSDGEGGTNPLDLNQMLQRFDVKGP